MLVRRSPILPRLHHPISYLFAPFRPGGSPLIPSRLDGEMWFLWLRIACDPVERRFPRIGAPTLQSRPATLEAIAFATCSASRSTPVTVSDVAACRKSRPTSAVGGFEHHQTACR